MPEWEIQYTRLVIEKHIPALDRQIGKRVQQAIAEKLTLYPDIFGKPLQYSLAGQRSLRVGDYRIVYQLDAAQRRVIVTAIGHRREIYEG